MIIFLSAFFRGLTIIPRLTAYPVVYCTSLAFIHTSLTLACVPCPCGCTYWKWYCVRRVEETVSLFRWIQDQVSSSVWCLTALCFEDALRLKEWWYDGRFIKTRYCCWITQSEVHCSYKEPHYNCVKEISGAFQLLAFDEMALSWLYLQTCILFLTKCIQI